MSDSRVYLGVGSPGPTGPPGAVGPPGVGANWRGLWASGTTYAIDDGVRGSNGHNYISVAAGNLNHDPTTDDGTHWSDLLPGSVVTVSSGTPTPGQVPVFTGSGNATTPGSAGVSGSAVTKTGAYTLTTSDHVVLADATSGAFALTLPTAVGYSGIFFIRAINTNMNQVTIQTTGGQTIDGSGSIVIGTLASGATYLAVTLISDGANWRIV